MDISNVIKWDQTGLDPVVWKFPSTEILLGSILIVGMGQEALLVRGGEVYDKFSTGTHALESANIPLISKAIGLPFGGQTPFTCEVWFVSKLHNMDLKWGTKAPIQIMDGGLGIPVSVRSHGRWGFTIQAPQRLLGMLVGSQSILNTSDISESVYGFVMQNVSRFVSNAITENKISVLQIAGQIHELSETIRVHLKKDVNALGIKLLNFNIESINIPETQLDIIYKTFHSKFEAQQFSDVEITPSFTQLKSLEIMASAAANETQNTVGSMFGVGIGGELLNNLNNRNVTGNEDHMEQLKKLHELYKDGALSEQQYHILRDKIVGKYT